MIYFSVECLYYDFIIIFRLEIFEIIELKCFSFSKRIIIFVDRLPNFNSIKMVSFCNNVPKFAHLFF